MSKKQAKKVVRESTVHKKHGRYTGKCAAEPKLQERSVEQYHMVQVIVDNGGDKRAFFGNTENQARLAALKATLF